MRWQSYGNDQSGDSGQRRGGNPQSHGNRNDTKVGIHRKGDERVRGKCQVDHNEDKVELLRKKMKGLVGTNKKVGVCCQIAMKERWVHDKCQEEKMSFLKGVSQ